MARVTVQYDATSGNDEYSGAGGTAVTGANGDISGTTITLNTTADLSAFAAGDPVWFEGNAGDRHLFEIASFTGGAATCTAIVTVESATAARTAKKWAVGGKRKTIDAEAFQPDFEDGSAHWLFDLGAGTFSISFASGAMPAADSSGRVLTIRGAGAANTTLLSNHNGTLFANPSCAFEDMTIGVDPTLSPSSSATLFSTSINGRHEVYFTRCIVEDFQRVGAVFWSLYFHAVDCVFRNLGDSILTAGSHDAMLFMFGCEVYGNGGHGVWVDLEDESSTVSQRGLVLVNCIIRDNSSDGVHATGVTRNSVVLIGNTIHGNGGNGFTLNSVGAISSFCVVNNIFSNHAAGYGISGVSAYAEMPIYSDFNGFYSNASGHRNNWPTGSNDVSLSSDPYTDEANDDYTLNATAGGGADLTGAGFPGTLNA